MRKELGKERRRVEFDSAERDVDWKQIKGIQKSLWRGIKEVKTELTNSLCRQRCRIEVKIERKLMTVIRREYRKAIEIEKLEWYIQRKRNE